MIVAVSSFGILLLSLDPGVIFLGGKHLQLDLSAAGVLEAQRNQVGAGLQFDPGPDGFMVLVRREGFQRCSVFLGHNHFNQPGGFSGQSNGTGFGNRQAKNGFRIIVAKVGGIGVILQIHDPGSGRLVIGSSRRLLGIGRSGRRLVPGRRVRNLTVRVYRRGSLRLQAITRFRGRRSRRLVPGRIVILRLISGSGRIRRLFRRSRRRCLLLCRRRRGRRRFRRSGRRCGSLGRSRRRGRSFRRSRRSSGCFRRSRRSRRCFRWIRRRRRGLRRSRRRLFGHYRFDGRFILGQSQGPNVQHVSKEHGNSAQDRQQSLRLIHDRFSPSLDARHPTRSVIDGTTTNKYM